VEPEAAFLPTQRVDLVYNDAFELTLLEWNASLETSVANLPGSCTPFKQPNQTNEGGKLTPPESGRPVEDHPPPIRCCVLSFQAIASAASVERVALSGAPLAGASVFECVVRRHSLKVLDASGIASG